MPEVKKNVKKMSNHAKKKARRKFVCWDDGYEYQMSRERYNAMYPEDNGELNHIPDIIAYLNKTGGFLKEITKVSVV